MQGGRSGAAQGGGISMEAMRAHLAGTVIGFRPGDPTAGPPPATMPAPLVPPPAGMQRVDLRQMSMEELHAAAAATQPRDVFAALLPDPPGVPPDRLAYVTGHAPAKVQKSPPLPQQQPQQQHQQQDLKQQRSTKRRVATEEQSQPEEQQQQQSTGRQKQQPKVQQQKQQQEQQPTEPRAPPAAKTAELAAAAAVLAAALAPTPAAGEAGATASKAAAAAAAGAAAGAGAAGGVKAAGAGAIPREPSQEQLLTLLARFLPAEPEGGPGSGSRPQAASPSASASVAGVAREAQEEAGAIPWEQLGMGAGGPRVRGLGCDLRRLWQLAYLDRGGFEAVCSAAANSKGGWAGVAEALANGKQQAAGGEDDKGKAALLVMECYRRWLLPYERHIRALKANGGSNTGGTAAAGDEAAAEGAEPSRKRKSA